MVFNMGGRPGQAVCERLFQRRGFRITKLWQTKILQVVRLWHNINTFSTSVGCSGFGLPGSIISSVSWCFILFSVITILLVCLQAGDTDISALVEIEKNSRHRFEFFMDLVGDQPICARTASAYMKSGGRISHALSVYSCQLRQPNQVTFFSLMISKSNNVCLNSTLIIELSAEENIWVSSRWIPWSQQFPWFII